eukprot:m.1585 g.1585  ORF g.1585 m.1585 type:complete len:57 (+) comp7296_c0_seq1:157-327(+)
MQADRIQKPFNFNFKISQGDRRMGPCMQRERKTAQFSDTGRWPFYGQLAPGLSALT